MSANIQSKSSREALSLAALGVVYGDIGTSPLYALRECFHPSHGVSLNDQTVLGILSLIIWSLLLIVTIKYLILVLRADNQGEGGILALTALTIRDRNPRTSPNTAVLIVLGLLGASFVYGDGIITPAISVLSAVEGLEIAAPFFRSYVLIIAALVLGVLFAFQRQGSGRIGRFFGPVILIWFLVLAVLGFISIVHTPHVVFALNPLFALSFLSTHAIRFTF
jgi:KUP system potassium uptake protein